MALKQSGLVLDLSFLDSGIPIVQSLSGLMYVDDILLFAKGRDELQILLDMGNPEGNKLG